MLIHDAAQELSPGAEIELFQLDLAELGGEVVLFHAGTNNLPIPGSVIWQGLPYERFPVKATGFEYKAQGTLPRPVFTASNVIGVISAMCRIYGDIVGARVIRKRTLARFLDAANFVGGNPTADPNESFPDEIWYVNQKTREDFEVVEFELATKMDVEGVQLPRRQVIRNHCPWRYRGDGCGYGGPPVADVNDIPTGDPANDVCGKRLSSCRLRFGNYGWLPFGGFPGASQYR
ncbi:lambda family phage minor tail protein L [Paraburkholderia atlantica]|uniref:phage minor tail protein L n=1 Tax=Paraburkholderia atlantica TaxID=2654982 RepID=UPI003D225F43